MEQAYIVAMHEKYNDKGEIEAYYYQLQTKLVFKKILLFSHKSETNETLSQNYKKESTHWLAYWKNQCPLIGINDKYLKENPYLVQFKITSTRYYSVMHNPNLSNFRNINIDFIEPCK